MTSKVRLTAWSPRLNKVGLTKLVRQSGCLTLDRAHDLVNRFLAGEAVELAFDSDEVARQFSADARTLGAETELVDIRIPAKS